MKNLTRVLALVLTFAMMISTVAMAATFADIEEGSTYAEATAVLSDLGILKGYEDGTFGPDKTITRAEVVAVVNRLQGLSDAAKAAGGATQYTDVPSTEWYAGDVNLATQMGIISGDGNGLFRPNDQVKYEEAVKMIVAALGYNQEYVLKRGGWPTGYLVIATEAEISKGMTAGAGDPALRGIVAKLAYNALTAPTFAFKEYSTDGKAIYSVNDTKITLEEKLQTYKLTGRVDANATTALVGTTKDNDEVYFTITADKVGKFIDRWSFPTNAAANYTTNDTFKIGATDIATTLGLTTDIYVAENAEGEWEIVSYVVNKVKNSTVVIEDPTTIMTTGAANFPSDFAAAIPYLSVYDDEIDTTNTTYDLDANAELIVNGQAMGTVVANATTPMFNLTNGLASDLGAIYAPAYGTVTLLDNNNNGAYDIVFVESYEVAVVEDVINTATAQRIYTKAGDVIDLTQHVEGRTGFTYSIELDGEEATIADLQEFDVIAVAKTFNGRAYTIKATRATVEGLVSEADTTAIGLADDEFIVDGVAYKVANLADQTASNLGRIGVGDEVVFYLDAFNNVALAERSSSSSKNYAFILGAGSENLAGDVTYQVRILDKEGNIATYNLAEKLRFANAAADGRVATGVNAVNVYNAITALNAGAWVKVTDWDNATAAQKLADLADYANRIVTYKTNSNGDISEIVFAGTRYDGTESYLTNNGAAGNYQYNAKTQSFINGYAVTEDTVVFNLPINTGATREDFEINTIASLSHEGRYDVAFLSIDDENVAKVMIVANNDATVAQGSNLAIATKVMAAQNAEYEDIYNITFIQNGEVQTLATTPELLQDIVSIKAGDVFEYSVNDEGAMDAIALGGNDGAAWNGSLATLNNFGATYNLNGSKEQYVFGVVYGKSNNRVVTLNALNGPAHAVSADANFYLVDLTKAKNNISISSYAELRAFKADSVLNQVIVDNDYAVFMKYYNDEITDVIVFKGYLTGGYDAQ